MNTHDTWVVNKSYAHPQIALLTQVLAHTGGIDVAATTEPPGPILRPLSTSALRK